MRSRVSAKTIMSWMGRIVGSILVVAYVVTLVSGLRLNVVPTKYLVILIPLYTLAVLVAALACFKVGVKNKWKYFTAVTLSILLIAASGYATVFSNNTAKLIADISHPGTKNQPKIDTSKPFVMYISGIDTYGNINNVSRSDVNILMVINPKNHNVLLVNTPRDYYVQLHGTTGIKDKLTHSGIYGINMSQNTMQDLYNTKINYYVRVNFTSLLNVIDSIGGVDVYSDSDFSADKYHFVKGYNHLDAKAALAFSRDRHSFADGDRTRGKDQERVLEAIIRKANNPAVLLRYQRVSQNLSKSVQTDMPQPVIKGLFNQQLSTLGQWHTQSISVTGSDAHAVTYSMGPQQLYVMVPNTSSLTKAQQAIASYLN